MSEWEKAREAALVELKRGRGCDAGNIPCPFCKWGPDEITAQFDETGCEWLLDAALSAFAEAGYVLVPRVPTIEMIGAMADVNARHSGMATPTQEYTAMITAALKDRT